MKVFSLASISAVSAHSWLACVDYLEKNGAYYDHDLCRGWPRDAQLYAPIDGDFGADKGFDHKPNSGTSPCKTSRDNNNYNNGHHSAVYYPGQQVVMAHPMKNHGTGPCTNPYIPDNGNWIYYVPKVVPGQPDPSLSVFKQNELVNLGKSPTGGNVDTEDYPKVGFANAPAFCENTDRALGTYSFNIPTDFETGAHTFSWVWAFNGPTDYYSTCFDVEIVIDKATRDNVLAARGQSDTRAICDTSNTSSGESGSTTGCGDVPATTNAPPTTPNGGGGTEHPTSDAIIRTNQMTGSISLTAATPGTTRREIHVVFFGECSTDVVPNFWYAELSNVTDENGSLLRKRRSDGGGMAEKHFVLIQDSTENIQRGMIGFHWGFGNDGCQLLQMPTVIHVTDS